ncbi:unnamed protein product (macronuclear) [Paramecium tetraurelia]|uniref:HTH psq-type domain-containing protein n=1 Tax=Paramecium tetraurelia TaxID=5888 RepID=A0CRH2_PARTE|nr:uncharacterized protein GSPATT00009704001 [Paramecium tetraurelia]CAK73389.1 unnamed protein product [Paramecium tetraurelia]|eukprot:XP_001440786.1 hypothetical protein (macronuclear) [Paramecium tetraurelia strain d4-2]
MPKKNTNSNRKGMVYNLNSQEERKRIMELKRQGKKAKEIATIMNKKQKSIESVNSEERKSEYKDFKQSMISYGLKIFKDKVIYDNIKKLAKKVRVSINQILSSKKNNEFRLLIPKGRKFSCQRRIKETIVSTIVSAILSRQNSPGNETVAIQNQKEQEILCTKENLEINKTYQNSNDCEESSENQMDDDQDDYLIIDPITPFHLGLKQETVNFFQSYQRVNQVNQIEDLSTNYANSFEMFKQSVELPSYNETNDKQLSFN